MAVEEAGEDPDGGVVNERNRDAGPAAALVAVAAMHRRGKEIREQEVERALRELGDDVDETDRAAIERLARRLVGRVLLPPTAGLLAGEDERVETALELLGAADDPPSDPQRTATSQSEPDGRR